jgi:hypothetical protein
METQDEDNENLDADDDGSSNVAVERFGFFKRTAK